MNKDHKGSRIGLYVTVIFHITVIVFLVATGLKSTIERTDDILIELLNEKEMEELQQQLEELERLKEMSNEGEASLYQEQQYEEVRNLAVDEAGELKDDRGTDAEELYRQHEKLMQELEEGKNQPSEEAEEEVAVPEEDNEKKEKIIPNVVTEGAVTIRFNVQGRRPVDYKIPAYKCLNGGTVVVQIIVRRNGTIEKASVIEAQSDHDPCLHEAAVRAAYAARFNASEEAPAKAPGTITYKFIPQY